MDTFILIIDLKPLRWICIFVLCWKKRFGNRVQFYHHRLSQGTSLSPVLMDQTWQVHFTGGLERAESSSGFLPQFKAQSLGRRRLEARAASNLVCSWALLQVSLWNCGFSMELWCGAWGNQYAARWTPSWKSRALWGSAVSHKKPFLYLISSRLHLFFQVDSTCVLSP